MHRDRDLTNLHTAARCAGRLLALTVVLLSGCSSDDDADRGDTGLRSRVVPASVGTVVPSDAPSDAPSDDATDGTPTRRKPARAPARRTAPVAAGGLHAGEYLLSPSCLPFQLHREVGGDRWVVIWSANDPSPFPRLNRKGHVVPHADPPVVRGHWLAACNGSAVTAKRYDELLRSFANELAHEGRATFDFAGPDGARTSWTLEASLLPLSRFQMAAHDTADVTFDRDAFGPAYRDIIDHIFAGRTRAAKAALDALEYAAEESQSADRFIAKALLMLAESESLGQDLYEPVSQFESTNRINAWHELVRTAAEFDPTASDRQSAVTVAYVAARVKQYLKSSRYRPIGTASDPYSGTAGLLEAIAFSTDHSRPQGFLRSVDAMHRLVDECFANDCPSLAVRILFWLESGFFSVLPPDFAATHRKPCMWQDRLLDHTVALLEAGRAPAAARAMDRYAQAWHADRKRVGYDDNARVGEVLFDLADAGQFATVEAITSRGDHWKAALDHASARRQLQFARESDVDWYEPKLELLDAGAEPRRPVRYRPAAQPVQIVDVTRTENVRVGSTSIRPPTTWYSAGIAATPRADGAHVVSFSVFDTELEETDGVKQGHYDVAKKFLVDRDGSTAIVVVDERGRFGDDAGDPLVGDLLSIMLFLEPQVRPLLPEEPIGVGARWRVDVGYSTPDISASASATLELKSLDQDGATIESKLTLTSFEGIDPSTGARIHVDEESITSSYAIRFDRPSPTRTTIKHVIKARQGRTTISRAATTTLVTRTAPTRPVSKSETAPTHGARRTVDIGGMSTEFVYVDPRVLARDGFLMGSPPFQPGRDDDEREHRVTLTRGYWIQTTEVTRAHFARFVRATGHKTDAERKGEAWGCVNGAWGTHRGLSWRSPGFDRHVQGQSEPVTMISWNDARAMCAWLRRDGVAARLPTEAEWELAARGGGSDTYAWGEQYRDGQMYANIADETYAQQDPNGEFTDYRDGFLYTAPVASFNPSSLGLYDMAGNVYEYCSDGSADYPPIAVEDPVGAVHKAGRVRRGGSWLRPVKNARPANRGSEAADGASNENGFRLVLDYISE